MLYRRILTTAEREAIEKERRKKLTEFARFFNGTDDKPNVAPVLPMNRFRFSRTSSNSKVKAGSRLPTPNNKIVLHPERVERNRRLAELYHYIKGA
jgi:hypothetical protein